MIIKAHKIRAMARYCFKIKRSFNINIPANMDTVGVRVSNTNMVDIFKFCAERL